MHLIDFSIFVVYMLFVLAVGVYFFKRNKNKEDYYVGGRSIKPWHVGLSVVATDVGGGFSIGLGGLGFLMGLSGSWLLFTGLVGAWLAAVFIIPKVKLVDKKHGMLTFPDFFRHIYNDKVALIAAIISGIGYAGFTGGQILAGVTLSKNTLFYNLPFGLDPYWFSLIVISLIILLYTVMGGLKAVIYTDTVQWIILLSGLILFGIPFTLYELGGFEGIRAALPSEFFTLTNVKWVSIVNWMITIIPIWFIAMTLYQRIYACKDVKDAKKAWFIAGVFEYPVMAFTGVFLGMCGRILFPEVESESGLPLLLKDVLPIGIKGIVIAAYFSAIMSTADSCLIASSGNFVNDILERYLYKGNSTGHSVRLSQVVTLIVGVIAVVVASSFESVLEVILHAYSFMVAGLLVPTLAAFFWKGAKSEAALISMLAGGTITLILKILEIELMWGLDPTLLGLVISALAFLVVQKSYK